MAKQFSLLLHRKDLRVEYLGAFALVLFGKAAGTASALKLSIAGLPLDSLTVALTFGMTLAVLVAIFAPHGPCHLNPAITAAMMVLKKLPKKDVLPFMASQVLGSITAALMLWVMFGNAGRSRAHLGASLPEPGANFLTVFLAEMGGAWFLVFVVAMVTSAAKLSPGVMAVIIGVTLAVCVIFAGAISGGAVNPAVALGPMLVSLTFNGLPAYLLAPLVGGVLAALLAKPFVKADKEAKERDDELDWANLA